MLGRIGAIVFDIIEAVVTAGAIFLFVYLLILQPHKIKGASMLPNFEDGELLLTDKISYRIGNPKRGDVVVFRAPPSKEDDFIKRIIGLPGETISIESGKVYIDGVPLEEDYIPPSIATLSGSFLSEGKQIAIGTDEFFVLGDNRGHSSDSRSWGFIKKEDIVGKAWLVYWPVNKLGIVSAAGY